MVETVKVIIDEQTKYLLESIVKEINEQITVVCDHSKIETSLEDINNKMTSILDKTKNIEGILGKIHNNLSFETIIYNFVNSTISEIKKENGTWLK